MSLISHSLVQRQDFQHVKNETRLLILSISVIIQIRHLHI
jgi:hypothetical protein